MSIMSILAAGNTAGTPRTQVNLTIAANNTVGYNIFANKGGTYVAGSTDVTLTINSGIYLGANSPSVQALSTGTGWTSGDTITVINNGFVIGRGGSGGNGANISGTTLSAPAAGAAGGSALISFYPVTVNNTNGTFAGAGGGGGGGGTARSVVSTTSYGGGGGGGGSGAGFPIQSTVGAGGTATGNTINSSGGSGSLGSITAGGLGGAKGDTAQADGGIGGAGGDLGQDGVRGGDGTGNFDSNTGEFGGLRGAYSLNDAFVTWIGPGIRLGRVAT